MAQFYRSAQTVDGFGSYCGACANEYNKGVKERKREAALQSLGGVCVLCGFSDPRALQIDHVGGGGKKDLASKSRSQHYQEVIDEAGSGKYQLLCANCNWIKRDTNNEHGSTGSKFT